MDTMSSTPSERWPRCSTIGWRSWGCAPLATGSLPELGPQLRRRVQRAQPAPAPARAEDRDLFGDPLGRSPLPLVGVLAAQKVEAPVPALDRTPDHRPHQHQPDAIAL